MIERNLQKNIAQPCIGVDLTPKATHQFAASTAQFVCAQISRDVANNIHCDLLYSQSYNYNGFSFLYNNCITLRDEFPALIAKLRLNKTENLTRRFCHFYN